MNNPPPANQQFITSIPDQERHQPALDKHKLILYGLGIAEIVLGGLSFVFAVAAIFAVGRYRIFTTVGQGIWCGGVLIACGILGIMTKFKPTRCMYNANLAMSIVATNFMGLMVILSALAAVVDGYGLAVSLNTMIALAGFIAFIITIIHSAYCCAGVCCHKSNPSQIFVATPQGLMPAQMVNGQVVFYPNSHVSYMPSKQVQPLVQQNMSMNLSPSLSDTGIQPMTSTTSNMQQPPSYSLNPPAPMQSY